MKKRKTKIKSEPSKIVTIPLFFLVNYLSDRWNLCLQFSLKKNQYPSICITWGRSCRLMVFHMTLQDEYAIIFNPHRTQRSRPSRKLLEHPPFHTCHYGCFVEFLSKKYLRQISILGTNEYKIIKMKVQLLYQFLKLT